MQVCREDTGEYSDDGYKMRAAFSVSGKIEGFFGYALVASIVLHLFSIGAVNIYIAPDKINRNVSYGVSFLGAILEEPVEARKKDPIVLNEGRVSLPFTAKIEIPMSENLDIRVKEKTVFIKDFDMLKEKESRSITAEEFTGLTPQPQRIYDKIKFSYKAYPSQMKGPVRFREVIYKPELPAYLKWNEELGVDMDRLGNSFGMELKFWVSREGKVGLVERISSSGHTTIDLVGMRYIKGWQFAPASGNGSQDEEWGLVRLSFNLTGSDQR